MLFFIFPWSVDVIQDRYPVVNWLIIVATIGVFAIQVRDVRQYQPRRVPYTPRVHSAARPRPSADGAALHPRGEGRSARGITGKLMLDGWGLSGLLGYLPAVWQQDQGPGAAWENMMAGAMPLSPLRSMTQ